MDKIEDVMMLSGKYFHQLKTSLTYYLDSGWELHGSMFSHLGEIHQPLIKRRTEHPHKIKEGS